MRKLNTCLFLITLAVGMPASFAANGFCQSYKLLGKDPRCFKAVQACIYRSPRSRVGQIKISVPVSEKWTTLPPVFNFNECFTAYEMPEACQYDAGKLSVFLSSGASSGACQQAAELQLSGHFTPNMSYCTYEAVAGSIPCKL